ncbi:hypothetical protein TS85_14680 [Sphingomonas hengshuiensis]|uniref:DUF418 domain-containing protein n=1 Tax=Sphingomonas hengshuiensis TaxID=1609977 RepID=A0A7U5BFY2_9SPHN|nr:hypothetical protein TS85_14680 [Sphingomonas hengshuiensis]
MVSLDIVRGVAVLGILLLNIVNFAMPEAAYVNPRAYGGWHGADLVAYLINFVLFDGKMRGLFSFLFGASMLLVIDRAHAAGRPAARVHFARMAWLLLFGLAHLWLVWRGDILVHYALIGMIAFTLRGMRVERLLALGITLVLANTLLFATMPLMVWQLSHPAADAAEAARNADALQSLVSALGVPPPAEIARELALYRSDYATILADRFRNDLATPLGALLFGGPETLAYMLFGMAGLRSGMLRGAWAPARYRRWLLVCWGIALPGYVALAAYLVASGFGLFAVALAVLTLAAPLRPLMITGWACLILLLARRGGPLAARLAATGRMAFTNYLATSLICTTLFYGYGLGWFGSLSRWQLYPVVALVWAAMLLWSQPWLARFRFGPFEWLWRSLARASLQPMRIAPPQ